jgi:hypothetical protein
VIAISVLVGGIILATAAATMLLPYPTAWWFPPVSALAAAAVALGIGYLISSRRGGDEMTKESDEANRRLEEMRRLPGWGSGVFIGPGAKDNQVIGNTSRNHKHGVASYGDGTIIKGNHSEGPKPKD